ncbi:MAG TPA: hypothetical protein VKM55_22210 [Candidatus Lokiarchaeia archaeon]|nr:hypothetical protein [Candidatus Lokiarchaeia archaeon]
MRKSAKFYIIPAIFIAIFFAAAGCKISPLSMQVTNKEPTSLKDDPSFYQFAILLPFLFAVIRSWEI